MTRRLEIVLIAGCIFLAAIEGPRALDVLRGAAPATPEEHVLVAVEAPVVAVLTPEAAETAALSDEVARAELPGR